MRFDDSAQTRPPSGDGGRVLFERASEQPGLVEERVRLHQKIVAEFNLASMEQVSSEDLKRQIRAYVANQVRDRNLALNQRELDALIADVIDEITGFGPLEPLLRDSTISDILVNTHRSVFVERFGQLEPAPVRFKDEDHLLRIVQRIVASAGRRLDEASPMVDARMRDGSRINVAIRPVAVDGPLVSIRKFPALALDMDRLVTMEALPREAADLLGLAVRERVSILVSGGTGTGKTTMLNALSRFIPVRERLVTIEDAAELQLQQPHVLRLETRAPNIEGRGEIRQRDLLKNALRMRPDRIIIGECRGEEAFDMLQAMNTGHDGSMSTIHANTPRDALWRLEQMVGMANVPMSQISIRHQIASAIGLVVQLQRLPGGERRVVSVSEVAGIDSEAIALREMFAFPTGRHGANAAALAPLAD
jgi:pilus assembly protein CpaF